MTKAKTSLRRRDRLALAIGSSLLTLVLLEGALHVFPPPISDRLLQPDERFGRFHVPGKQGWHLSSEFSVFVTINSLGLRDTEHTYAKPDGVYRVLLLGDSYVEGMQVPLEDTVGKRLEQELNSRGGRPYEVINGAVSGFGTDAELLFYRQEGRRYGPALVLLFFYRNDLIDNAGSRFFTLDRGHLRFTQPQLIRGLPLASRGWLWDHVILARVAGTALSQGRTLIQRLTVTPEPPVDRACPASITPSEEAAWPVTTALLAEVAREVRADGATLVVVGIPDLNSVEAQRAYPLCVEDQVNHRLAGVLAELGIPFIDLLPEFASYQSRTGINLYWPTNRHFTSAGHKLASDVVSQALVERGFLRP